jgi:hypothetical protein
MNIVGTRRESPFVATGNPLADRGNFALSVRRTF